TQEKTGDAGGEAGVPGNHLFPLAFPPSISDNDRHARSIRDPALPPDRNQRQRGRDARRIRRRRLQFDSRRSRLAQGWRYTRAKAWWYESRLRKVSPGIAA